MTYADFPGSEMAALHVQGFINSAGADLTPKLMAAQQAGFAADDDLRRRLAARYRDLDSLTLEALQDTEYNAPEGRYLELVSVINDQPHPDAALLDSARREQSDSDGPSFRDLGEWLSAAILAAR